MQLMKSRISSSIKSFSEAVSTTQGRVNILKKTCLAIISAFIGLILIPIFALEPRFLEALPILVILFLLPYCIILVIVFELLTRIEKLRFIISFLLGHKVLYLFLGLLTIEWIIILTVKHSNDVVFTVQFATATVPAMVIYARQSKRMNLLAR